MGKVSKLARSHNLFIDFLNVSVLFDTVVYSAIPYEKIKAYYMFLRRSLVHISYMYMIFFFFSIFGGLPPPPIPKSWLPSHQKSGQMKMADSVTPPPPPARYTKSPPLHEVKHKVRLYEKIITNTLRVE